MTVRLLIVDDSDLIRDSLLGLLEGIPGLTRIDTTASLCGALACVARLAPTLLILDLHLSDGDATPIIPTLRNLAAQMRIAILTNDASAFNRKKCLASGADWFFDKSTEFENLLDVVRQQAALH